MDERIAHIFSQAVAETYSMVKGEGLASLYRPISESPRTEREDPLPLSMTACAG